MIFSNNYRKTSLSYQKSQMIMNNNKPYITPIAVPTLTPSAPKAPGSSSNSSPSAPNPVKLKWGKPIWTFFHVMAQKMKDEHFHILIPGFMQMIVSICSILPCPICSKHAIEYINSTNINNIRSKTDLIDFFHRFHNAVNQRKGYAFFPRENVVATYENLSTYLVIREFMFHFEDRHRSTKLMAEDFLRRRVVPQVKTWINTNIQYFDI